MYENCFVTHSEVSNNDYTTLENKFIKTDIYSVFVYFQFKYNIFTQRSFNEAISTLDLVVFKGKQKFFID